MTQTSHPTRPNKKITEKSHKLLHDIIKIHTFALVKKNDIRP